VAKRTCQYCRYWADTYSSITAPIRRDVIHNLFSCCRYPPAAPEGNASPEARWPHTYGYNFCGEWADAYYYTGKEPLRELVQVIVNKTLEGVNT